MEKRKELLKYRVKRTLECMLRNGGTKEMAMAYFQGLRGGSDNWEELLEVVQKVYEELGRPAVLQEEVNVLKFDVDCLKNINK